MNLIPIISFLIPSVLFILEKSSIILNQNILFCFYQSFIFNRSFKITFINPLFNFIIAIF